MTAMVDIVFFLLIFFLVTSMQGLDSAIPMPTPEADQAASGTPSAQPSTKADNSIVVNIDEEDRVWVEGTEMANEQELVAKLEELHGGPGNPNELLIIGSGDATHGTAVMVHDSANTAGLDIIRLAIETKSE
jgi:biopolymer transport protein ExbD